MRLWGTVQPLRALSEHSAQPFFPCGGVHRLPNVNIYAERALSSQLLLDREQPPCPGDALEDAFTTVDEVDGRAGHQIHDSA